MMISIFGIQFGSRFVATKKYEATLIKEKQNYERFIEFENSELLKRYQMLETQINAPEFQKRVQFLKTAKYKETEDGRKLSQYKTMSASPDIKTYLKVSNSGILDRMNEIQKSDLFKEFNDLKIFVNSSAFHSAKAKKDFKQSEAYSKQQQFKELQKDPDIVFYLKNEKNSNYRQALKLEKSERLQTFRKLEEIVQSSEFLDNKVFMEDKKRYKNSEEAALVREFNELQKNEEIKWYFEMKKTNPFKEVRKWSLTFEDDFDGLQLDKSRWMTGYYWGKALMNENYVLAGEKQFFREDNLEMRDSEVRITTKHENFRGKVWDASLGFTMQEFDYTSGLISTGQSFRQKYGKFEAKVKFSEAFPVLSAFWMVGEKMTPQIDVCKSAVSKGKGIESGMHITTAQNQPLHLSRKVTGANFKNKFFIYALEWSSDAIIWKINGEEVHRETKHIPDEPMYLSFCTILPENPVDKHLPAYMDIDWIRCYKRNEEA